MNREIHLQLWEGVGLRCPALLAYLNAYQNMAEARRCIAACFDFYNDCTRPWIIAPRACLRRSAHDLSESVRGKNAGAIVSFTGTMERRNPRTYEVIFKPF
jgi:hypothetical protein